MSKQKLTCSSDKGDPDRENTIGHMQRRQRTAGQGYYYRCEYCKTAPFKLEACREGTLNKPFFSHFPSIVSEKSLACLASARRQIKIETIHDFGLRCHPNEKLAAFSPDAIAGVLVEDLPPSSPKSYVAFVKTKSKCSQATLTQENKLIVEFGEYQEINAEEDPDLFKRIIPDVSYRCQLLHGMASGALDHAFDVVASLHKIIHVVHVRVGSLIREQYLSVISNLGLRHLNWIEDGVVPAMTFKAGSHAVDHHSVQRTLDLWRALCNLIQEQQRPIPAGLHLIPKVVATWNRGNGPNDVYSCFQKNCKSVHLLTSWSGRCNLVEVDYDMCLQCVPYTQSQSNGFISSQ
jgi:hypothetical protein